MILVPNDINKQTFKPIEEFIRIPDRVWLVIWALPSLVVCLYLHCIVFPRSFVVCSL